MVEHSKTGKPGEEQPGSENQDPGQDALSDDHIQELADLISGTMSAADDRDEDTGSFPAVQDEDTGEFEPVRDEN